MIDPKSKFTVILDDNGVFSHLTEDMSDLTRDNTTIQMVSTQDKLYVGFTKPFNTLYVELFTPNTTVGSFAVEIFDGSTWVSTSLTDNTKGFIRSGFMSWDKTTMKATNVNSVNKFYIRLTPSVNHSSTVIRGINLIFADDSDLKSEFFEIQNSNILPTGEVSHIGTHVATRNYIIHSLRNHYSKLVSSETTFTSLEKINQFDLIDIFEIREAAIFLSLSKIFFNLSDNPEDHWFLKYKEYLDKYEQKIIVARLSIDQNNDGVDDANEKQEQFNPVRWAR